MALPKEIFKQCMQDLPKVELHNHLEGGAMFPDLALRLAKRNGLELPFTDVESAKQYYAFTSLDQFIGILRTTVATLNTAEDYADVVARHGQEAARQNIRYHELFVTYGLVSRRGVPWQAVVEGLIEGRKRNAELGVETAFIIDLDRTLPEDIALDHVEKAAAVAEATGVVGLGLDCQERGYPAGRLSRCFDVARSYGLRLTAHAGEDGGAQSIWDALKQCHVERIDHGVQAASDPALLSYLSEHKILLTVCPVSNVALKVFPSIAEHSLPQLLSAGIPVCLNSDDPPMFDSDLLNEFAVVETAFGLDQNTQLGLMRNAIEYSFQADKNKQLLLQEFDAIRASYYDH